MFARAGVLSLAFSCLATQAVGLDLDVNSQDSIKSTAKTLAAGIVAAYNESLAENLIPGLFLEPYYWWEAGAVWNGLIGYSFLTGDSQYNALVSEALQWQLGDLDAFMPPNQTKTLGNEDQSVWGLAAMTAAEVGFPKPKEAEWATYAANVFNTQAQRFAAEESANGTCGGGLRWQIFAFNNGFDFKDASSNGNFFLLAARLAQFTQNETYSQWAEKSFNWAQDVGLITEDYSVFQGTDALKNCSDINRLQFTNSFGVYTEGAALMYNLTKGADKWKSAVQGFVDASSVFHGNSSGVLVEVACESNGNCDTDMRAFKGIAARSFARSAVAAPFVSDAINRFLEPSAKGAANACSGSGADVACKLSWADPESSWESASAKDGNLGEVFGALEVVQGLLYKNSQPLATSNATGNSTQTGPSTSRPAGPESTGAAGTVSASLTAVLVVALAAVLQHQF